MPFPYVVASVSHLTSRDELGRRSVAGGHDAFLANCVRTHEPSSITPVTCGAGPWKWIILRNSRRPPILRMGIWPGDHPSVPRGRDRNGDAKGHPGR